MDKDNIVALEDRIPKLKQQRRRKANRRLIFLLFLFFTLFAIIAYIQSPLSHVKTIAVSGNEFYSSEEVIHQTGLSTQTNIWKVKKNEIVRKLQLLPEIKKAGVKVKWPNSITIQVSEHKRVAYLKKDLSYYPILDNGQVLQSRKISNPPVNAPIVIDFKEGSVLNEMVAELQKLPEEITNSISEIHYTPHKTDNYHISLFMNDGFEVSATIRDFAAKMVHYPSILSQLDPNKKGIIDLEVGSFFKAFGSEGDAKVEENKSKR